MREMNNLIIGFGKGGKTLAKKLASHQEKVIVIEADDKMYGGTCINVGCIPSKTLITQGLKQRDFTVAAEKKRILVDKLRHKNYHMLADEATIEVIHGYAQFKDNHIVQVQLPNGDVEEIKAERIFINTGSKSVIPKIEGLSLGKRVGTSKEMMDLTDKPEKLVILGAGYIGLEFAFMFANFGSQVTVLDNRELLGREDEAFVTLIQEQAEKMGIHFKLDAQVQKVDESAENVTVSLADETLTADYLLVATGRKPNTEALGLENTDIQVDARGAIQTDEFLQTAVENVWALGDVRGDLQFTYISLDDFRIVYNQLFQDKHRSVNNRPNVPYTMFIQPAFSHVGLHEKEAQAKKMKYRKFTHLNSNVPKANILENPVGMWQILVDEETDQVLGATIFGEESYEVINLLTLAMNAHVPYQLLRDQIYTHPTMSEALNDVLK